MRKRIINKAKDPLAVHPDAWLVLMCGMVFNERELGKPAFRSLAAVKEYWEDNRIKLVDRFYDSWAWHMFEEHDRATCEYCKRFNIAGDIKCLEVSKQNR